MNPILKRGLKILAFGAIGGALAAVIPFLNSNPTLWGGASLVLASILGAAEKAIPNNF